MANNGAIYADTNKELAHELGISVQALYKWTSKRGFPKRTKHGWNLKKCREYYEAKHAERRNGNGALSEAKQEEAWLRNELLKQKLADAKGELMPVSDHLLELQQHAQIVKECLRVFVDEVRVVDKTLSRKVERLEKRMLRRLQRAVSNA